jgi:hypothetical protein
MHITRKKNPTPGDQPIAGKSKNDTLEINFLKRTNFKRRQVQQFGCMPLLVGPPARKLLPTHNFTPCPNLALQQDCSPKPLRFSPSHCPLKIP